MPRAILSGQSLANAIYAITDKLEAEFAAEFIAQMRKLSRRKSLQELLDQIEGGYYSSVATIPTSLLSLQIDTSKLNAIARKAMGSAARITDEKIGLNIGFNVRNPTIIEAARNISVDLSTNLSQTSQKILDKVIGDAMEGIVTRREAVKIIESRVGLLPTHSDAVDRYYDTLIQSGATKANAKKLADKYADRLLRYRANTIARTEIARATGIGQAEFWRQAVADGSLPPDAKRVWTTSYDERVCEICGPMNNIEVGIFEQWLTPNGFVDYPSAIHPNCRCSQGIAMSAAQKRLFVGKTDGEQFENYVLSKFNPNHDELGRFTFASGNRTISAKPKMSRRALGLKGKVSSIIRFSSAERKAAVEKLATEGSSKLLMPPDANGIAQVLPQGAADKRYGKTVAQIKKSIAKLGVESVVVTPEFAKGKNARRQMQATAQALEEAKAMGIPIDKLTMRFTTALRDADGEYGGDQDKRAGDMVIDYTDDRRAKLIADNVTRDSAPRILNAPTVAQTEYTSDYPIVTSQEDLVAKYTYGVTVHELGHHYTYINANNPNAKRQFGLETPAKYGTSDVYEMLAEGFTAWWLLGNSKVKSTQTFYKRWIPFVKVVLNGNDTGFGIPTPEALLKAMVRKTKVLNLLELSPTHPLMVYLTDGASIPDDIEKFNPNHDELGRFTFASGTRTKMPSKKPTLIDWKAKNEYDDKARQVASQILRGGYQDERLFSVVDTNDDNSALFIGKEDDVPTPFIKSMYEVENGGLTSKVKKVQFYDSFGDEGEGARRSGSLSVITEIYDSKGKKVGYADRSLVISDGQLLEISHNNFSLDKEYTGSGFGAVFFSNSIAHYEEVGASTVVTQANIDVGGYAWAKAGFSFQYESSLGDIGERAGDICGMSSKGVANTFLERMTNGRFTDVDSVKTSSALSDESKKKIIKSIEKAEKKLEQSKNKRTDLYEDLESGMHLGSRNSGGSYDEDYPNGYTPKKFAELGKEDSVKILVPVRAGLLQNEFVLKEVEMWVGKATMLGSDWGAVLVLGDNDEWEPQR